jgi:intracellular sulfur oxidation DsrE/DsrF family protein
MSWSPLARRSFLSQVGTGVTTVVGASLAGGVALEAQSAGNGRRQPSHHTQDEWLDKIAGQHRFIMDTTTPDGFGSAILYANNFLTTSQNAYGLKDADSAVVIVARHFSTVFAYNDTIWAKYGAGFSQRLNFLDSQTKQAPKINVYNSAAHVATLPSFNTTLDTVLKRGVHLAVCQMATRFFAMGIAEATGGNADTIYNELASNVVANSHMVPAGIVAVSRAQEHGYTFSAVG